MAAPQDANPMRDLARRLRGIEQKLDVLIEAQDLQEALAKRVEEDRETGRARGRQRDEQFRRASGRQG